MREKIVVMLTTEGTYPFHQGGVSTWCNTLVTQLDNVEFVVYSILMRLVHIILNLHMFFQEYEYKVSFKSEETRDAFKEIVFLHHADARNKLPRPDLYCLIQSLDKTTRKMKYQQTDRINILSWRNSE